MKRRCLGNGRIWRRKQKNSAPYIGDWVGADGARHRQVLSTDRGIAYRKMAEIIRRRDLAVNGLDVEEGNDLPAEGVIGEFMADLRSRRTARYADRVEEILRRVVASMKVRRMRDFRPDTFLQHRQRRVMKDVANRTVNLELTTVRTLLNWAVRVGYIASNPLGKIQPLPSGRAYERHPRRPLTEDEIPRFLAAARQIDDEAARRAAAEQTIMGGTKGRVYAVQPRRPVVPQLPLWLTLIETGARFGETAQTTWGDLSEADRALTLRAATTKSRKERVIPLREALVKILVELRVLHSQVYGRIPTAGDLIFLTPKGAPWVENRRNALRRLKQVLRVAGIPQVNERGEKIDIHALRYTCASRLARNGVGLAKAQKLLGHSDPKLTAQIYTHLDTEDLRGAVDSLPPLRIAEGS